jgi:hypothetical protein
MENKAALAAGDKGLSFILPHISTEPDSKINFIKLKQ